MEVTSCARTGSRERSKMGTQRSCVQFKNSRFIFVLPDGSAMQPLKNDLPLCYMKTRSLLSLPADYGGILTLSGAKSHCTNFDERETSRSSFIS